MAYVYKKFTAQDYAVVPFNAHKQYDFVSSSAALNQITVSTAKWSKESVDTYSSSSLNAYSLPIDINNSVKYNQIDHLFYKNYKTDSSNRFGQNPNITYSNHKRVLYDKVDIISIPAGLYGYEIKPGSFFLSSGSFQIEDDSKGNLIIKGTNVDDYCTDIKSNILNIGPVNGFKKYDLNTIDGYLNDIYYRKGKPRINRVNSYSTPTSGDIDDSYYHNPIKYKEVTFSKKALGQVLNPNRLNAGAFSGSFFPGIDFNGSTSEIRLGHNEKFNFNKGDDFTISLFASVSHSITDTSYLISKSTTKTTIPSPTEQQAGLTTTNFSGALQPIDVPAPPQFPFEVFVTGEEVFFKRSDGNLSTIISSSFQLNYLNHVTCRVSDSNMKIFVNGVASSNGVTDRSKEQTQNTANVYIGNKGGSTNFLSGSLSQINIFNKALNDTEILNHYSSSNGSPYVGNIFYQNGFATITHPKYQNILSTNFSFRTGSKFPQQNTFGSLTGSRVSDILFNNDGTRMYTLSKINDIPSISQFNLSTAFDISTSIFHVSKSFNTGVSANFGHFNNDGSAIFVTDSNDNKVRKFNITTPFDISGGVSYASQEIAFSGASNPDEVTGITFNPEGSKMYLTEQRPQDRVFEFDLSTPFDVSTAINVHSSTTLGVGNIGGALRFNAPNGSVIGGGSIQGAGIVIDSGGTRLLLSSQAGGSSVFEFYLNAPFRLQSAVFIRRHKLSGGGINGLQGMFTRGNKIFGALSGSGGNGGVHDFTLNTFPKSNMFENIKFQGSHLIYENEYQCTVDEYEFNDTMNISARKIKTTDSQDVADFVTGSLFKPYVTTIGLYNEDNELLVVGKLGQPVRMSDETDTTFVLRWDT